MAEFLEDELRSKFAAAADFLPSLVSSLKPDQLLKFYAYYKQATIGKCNTPTPYWYNFQNKQKWDAWKSLGDLSEEDAMKQYIALLDELSPDWEDSSYESKKENWVSVSRMLSEDSNILEEEKNIFDRVKEGDIDKVKDLLDINHINNFDEFGMSLLHWAADRGLKDMVICLLDLGADINLKDGAGQTALHYACCCGHYEIVELLLSRGADRKSVV